PSPRPAPAAGAAGGDTVRRALLLLLTGMVVARPLVPGEDPGLTSDLTDAGGPLLVLLTLVAGVAWAGWRLWARRGELRVGVVEVALLVGVALLFFSAGTASYKRPAWLSGWEWAALALLLFLIRQLAAGPDEQHGLFAAVLAGGVALSAFGVYQAAVDLPREARQYGEEREALREALARRSAS